MKITENENMEKYFVFAWELIRNEKMKVTLIGPKVSKQIPKSRNKSQSFGKVSEVSEYFPKSRNSF